HQYLHLATHGFFAGDGMRSALDPGAAGRGAVYERPQPGGWHPGLLSGLALAGANHAPSADQEGGVLTALEVAELNLGGGEMVVLSACETGLGKEAGGEGLLGLQRAFQVAGARTTVGSLWQVDDDATQQLMASFYDRLWSREPPPSRLEALRQAQLSLLR